MRHVLPHHSHPVILAVTDVDHSLAVDVHPMRPSKAALERVAVRAVMPRAVADNRLDQVRLGVDAPDRVAFRIRDIDRSVGSDSDALGAGELGLFGRAAVAFPALLARAREMVQGRRSISMR